MSYRKHYHESINNSENFWLEQAQQLNWDTVPKKAIHTAENGSYTWFPDGMCNITTMCLDTHLSARAHQIALYYDSPVTGKKHSYTYEQLHNKVARFAGALVNKGIQKGDTIVIYMPMIPEAVIAMLACARIGAIHSVVFGGFAPHELALRMDDCAAKMLITASYGIEVDKKIHYLPMVKAAVNEAKHKPQHIVVAKREQHDAADDIAGACDFEQMLSEDKLQQAVSVPSNHPLYILYTSGTTGKPKGVLREHGSYATALKYSMNTIYATAAGETFFAASDIGWVVGHSYIVYGPLLQGCSTILYEGKPVKTPDAGAFWRMVEEYKVSTLFAAPTAIRAVRKEDPDGTHFVKHNTASLKAFYLAGERCDISTYDWLQQLIKKPVIDHWWQTESGWPMLGIQRGIEELPAKPGSAGLPICGFNIHILNDEGVECEVGKEGFIAVKLPLPPGCLTTLWNNHERFVNGYLTHYPGYYFTGDGGYKDQDGYFYVLGRVDDVINVAGHRLSTGEMEEIISSHKLVSECAVVGIKDDLRGQRPLAWVVIKEAPLQQNIEIEKQLIELVREKIGAVAYLRNVLFVKRLPKTRSGKILRRTLRDIYDDVPHMVPSTIEEPLVLDEIKLQLGKV